MSLKADTKIEWANRTWNIVTGCYHPCGKKYCYVPRITTHFGGSALTGAEPSIHLLDNPIMKVTKGGKLAIDPYPYGSEPTFFRYLLQEPLKKKKSLRIFVSSMGDLFGNWVPRDWILEILEVVKQCPQHKFLFLTKNPEMYKNFDYPSNCWLGTSITCQDDLSRVWDLSFRERNNFISIEPLQGPIKIGCMFPHWIDWVIIGAQTGHNAIVPDPRWVDTLLSEVHAPVFIKNNVKWPTKVQEFPSGLILKR